MARLRASRAAAATALSGVARTCQATAFGRGHASETSTYETAAVAASVARRSGFRAPPQPSRGVSATTAPQRGARRSAAATNDIMWWWTGVCRATCKGAERRKVAAARDRHAATGAPRAGRVRAGGRPEPQPHGDTHGGAGEGRLAATGRRDGGQPQAGSAALNSRHPRAAPTRQVRVDRRAARFKRRLRQVLLSRGGGRLKQPAPRRQRVRRPRELAMGQVDVGGAGDAGVGARAGGGAERRERVFAAAWPPHRRRRRRNGVGGHGIHQGQEIGTPGGGRRMQGG